MEKREKLLLLIPQIASAVISLGACLVLLGWILAIPALTSFVPGIVAMNPTTAVLFLLTAVGLGLKTFRLTDSRVGILRAILGAVILVCGLAVIIEYSVDWQIEIDRVLFSGWLGENRMAPNTATYFAIVGLAFLSLRSPWACKWISQPLALIVLVGAGVSLLGYGYGAEGLYGIGNYIPMALNTSLLFVVVAIGLLCAVGPRGLVAMFCGAESGSVLIRRLLPTAIVVPCVLGFLRVLGQRAGWYDTEFGAALMVVTTVILLVTAIAFTARALNRTDAERLSGVAALQATHQELQSQTQILQSILDSMGDGVVVANERGQFMQFNPAAERILGLGPSDVGPEEWTRQYGCYLPDGVTPCPPEQLPLARALRGDVVAEDELFIRNASLPRGAWISVTGRPLREASGALKGGVVVFRDISERKRMDEALRNSHEDLERRVIERTKELAETNRELSQKNQENEMFVYSVSHDLRSPLVNLQGFSKELDVVTNELKTLLTCELVPEAIRKQATTLLDGDVLQSLQFIQSAVTRLGNIIDALLRLSRVGRVEYQCGRVDTQALVVRVLESMSASLYDAGINVRVQELSACYGDETALEQLFANLIGNAIKYRNVNRESTIEIGMADNQLAFAGQGTKTYYVKDNGLGIPAAHQDKIFQAFRRAHPHIAHGEGMGLAIVRRTAERHGGIAWVESKEGQGSTFFVTLPVRALARPAETDKTEALEGGIEHAIRTNGDLAGGRR